MESSKKIKRIAAIATILLLMISLTGNIMLKENNSILKNESDESKLNAEKSLSEKLQVEKGLANSQADLENANKRINEQGVTIVKQTSTLSADATKIKKLLKENLITPSLKIELTKLKELKELLQTRVEKLVTENLKLKDDFAFVQADYDSYRNKINAKIDLAKQLKAYDISVTTLKRRRLSKKEMRTEKASRVNQIRVNFDLIANPFAETGTKEIEMKIVNERGVVLSDPANNTFASLNPELTNNISASTKVNYLNQDTQTSIEFLCKQRLTKGNYTIQLFNAGKLCGEKKVCLK